MNQKLKSFLITILGIAIGSSLLVWVVLKPDSNDSPKYEYTYAPAKYSDPYFKSVDKETLSNLRGDILYEKDSDFISRYFHLLTNYQYFYYSGDEFSQRKLKQKHKDSFREMDPGKLYNRGFYTIFHKKPPRSANMFPYDFSTKEFKLVGGFWNFISAVCIDCNNRKPTSVDISLVSVEFSTTPREDILLHQNGLKIKIPDESVAEKFKNSGYTLRVNFDILGISTKKIESGFVYASRGEVPYWGSSPAGRNLYSTRELLARNFKFHGKIRSIEIHSDAIGTLVWIP